MDYRHGIHELGDGIYVHIPDDVWANTGIIVGDEGVLIIDARVTPRMARELIEAVSHITSKPIKYLVDTHHHGDHVFGNCVYAPFAAIVGHVNTRRTLAANPNMADSWKTRFSELAADLEEVVVVPPSITYTDALSIHMGPHTVELKHFGHGHTDGDTVVMVPDAGVAFLGDLLCNGVNAVLGDAHSHGWENSLRAVESIEEVHQVIGGHGPVDGKAALERQRQYIVAFREGVKALREGGMPPDEAAKEFRVVPGFEDYPNPERIAMGVRRIYQELAS